MAFLPEACDYLADNKKDIVNLADTLEGDLVKRYKELAAQEKIWLSLGGIHELVLKNNFIIYILNFKLLIPLRGATRPSAIFFYSMLYNENSILFNC